MDTHACDLRYVQKTLSLLHILICLYNNTSGICQSHCAHHCKDFDDVRVEQRIWYFNYFENRFNKTRGHNHFYKSVCERIEYV
jgi:hypothetical protein